MGQPLKTLRHQWRLFKQMEHFQYALFSCGDLFCVTTAILVLCRAVMQKSATTMLACWLLRRQQTCNVVKTIIHRNDRELSGASVWSLPLKNLSSEDHEAPTQPYPSIPMSLLELGPNPHQILLSTVQLRWQVRLKSEWCEIKSTDEKMMDGKSFSSLPLSPCVEAAVLLCKPRAEFLILTWIIALTLQHTQTKLLQKSITWRIQHQVQNIQEKIFIRFCQRQYKWSVTNMQSLESAACVSENAINHFCLGISTILLFLHHPRL